MRSFALAGAAGLMAIFLCAPDVARGADGAGASEGANPGASAGQAAFNNNCRTCHSMKEGDNRLGPSLAGIVGRKAGSNPSYPSYSQALKSSDLTWDEATLDRFVANPEAVVPNNNMKPFKGVPDSAVRKSIVEYVRSQSG